MIKCICPNTDCARHGDCDACLVHHEGNGYCRREIRIIALRDNPEYVERAADYLASCWGVPRVIYADCIAHSLTTDSLLPRWYVMLRGERVIGSYGLIVNDFNSRHDLWPWLAALHVNENERGQALGARLLAHGVEEAAKLGYEMLYLFTDHEGYYEKYGWAYMADAYGLDGAASRVYACATM